MDKKEKYEQWCLNTYVPVFSKPFWMDAVCGKENWDVWLYENGGSVLAAMPYYLEYRDGLKYITKAKLTQNNGIIFKEDNTRKTVTQAEFEERVIEAVCDYLDSLNLDVYEQQYQTAFTNWMPFYWKNYTNILRYTYIIKDLSDMDDVWNNISSRYRNKIRKGQRETLIFQNPDADLFYNEHEKVFLSQGLKCPFSRELWKNLYNKCLKEKCGTAFWAQDREERVHAVLFLVWDEKRVYQILGGYMREFSSSQAYPALIYHGLQLAHEMGLAYDFEGSMIKPISKAFRQFGGEPVPYYRIRKVFNASIIRKEAEDYINKALYPFS